MSGGIAWGSFASRCAREQAENKMRLKWQNQGGNRLVDAATRALYFIEIAGGCTRTRTLDPLIKSQLLYQLSYAPATGRVYSKALPACR